MTRSRVTFFLCSLAALTYLDRICISIVGTRVSSDLDLDPEQFGWVLAAFSLSYALFEIPSGMLGDRIGPRVLFIRIVLLWSVFTAATGLVQGLIGLIIVRFLFGIGESGAYPNALLVVSRWFPANETGRVLMWLGLGSQIGSAVAPLVIVPLAANYGWRVPFFVNAGIGMIWVWFCFSWFRDFPSEMKTITEEEKKLIESRRRHSTNERLFPLSAIFRNPTLWPLMAMYFCCQWSNYFFVAWMPLYLQRGRGFSETEMKMITFTLFTAGIAGFLAGGFAADRFAERWGLRTGRRVVGLTGLAVCGLMIAIAATTAIPGVSATCLVIANFAFAFGVMVSYAVCTDIGRNNAGTVTGAMNFCGQMGAFTLSLIFGRLVTVFNDYGIPLLVVGGVSLAGALLWLAIDPTRQIGGGTTSSG